MFVNRWLIVVATRKAGFTPPTHDGYSHNTGQRTDLGEGVLRVVGVVKRDVDLDCTAG